MKCIKYNMELKELFEKVLLKYQSVTPASTYGDLYARSMHWGICRCICDMSILFRLGLEVDEVLTRNGVTPSAYYAPTPSALVTNYDWPIGQGIYDACIVPRVKLLENIVNSLV